jgi:hypothetical protein
MLKYKRYISNVSWDQDSNMFYLGNSVVFDLKPRYLVIGESPYILISQLAEVYFFK